MYKILIVDDEKMIREGIKAVIEWKRININEVLIASSGRQALRLIEKEKPHILLTDISMTEMTGLELIEQASQLNPKMRMLVLTGYDSFEYARKALQLKVQDFLLKPVEQETLTQSIAKQVKILEEEERQKQLELEQHRVVGVKEQGRLGAFIRDLIHNRSVNEAMEYIKENYPQHTELGFIVAILSLPLFVEKKTDSRSISNWQLLGICEDFVDSKGKGISLWDDDGNSIIIVLFANRCGSDGIDLITEIAEIIRSELGQKPKLSVGNEVADFQEIKKSYQEAVYLLESEESQIHDVLLTKSVLQRKRIYQEVYEEMTEEMCQNISNVSYVMHVFHSFQAAVHSYNLSESYVRKCCFEITSNLYYANVDAGCPKPQQTLEAFADSISGAGIEAACGLTKEYLEKMLTQDQEKHEMIRKAKQYINQHLAEPLSVASIAENLFISANYFSRLFKRVTSEGCNEYIVRKRMEKACTLLKTTTFNTGKIAIMVGYNDSNYFSIAFKKHVGSSPTHYRNGQE